MKGEYFSLGITGTRGPLSRSQIVWLNAKLAYYSQMSSYTGRVELHHGDCIGADTVAHMMANMYPFWVVVHPPSSSWSRSFCIGHETWHPAPFMQRNYDIVKCADELLALPKGPEVLRSGSWSTIRRARDVIPVDVCLP